MARVERPFFSVTDNGNAIRRNTLRGEIPFRRMGSAFSEGEVILFVPLSSQWSFHLDLHVWIF